VEFVNKSTVKLIKHNASDEDVAHAAWVSNFGTGAVERDTTDVSKLINFLYTNKHMSPFEHGSFTFFIDTPIFVAREFMRHRTFSYNETSGRYKKLEPRFYLAPNDRPLVQEGKIGNYTFVPGSDEQYHNVEFYTVESYNYAWMNYKSMLEAGIAKEVARNVLPVGTMTQFYATCNPRNLMQFLTLRNDDPALYEIRKVAEEMEKIFAQAMPLTYAAYASARDNERHPPQVVEVLSPPETLSALVDQWGAQSIYDAFATRWPVEEIPAGTYSQNDVRQHYNLNITVHGNVDQSVLADKLLAIIDRRNLRRNT
jgi:thymidylate synthase (FAD)